MDSGHTDKSNDSIYSIGSEYTVDILSEKVKNKLELYNSELVYLNGLQKNCKQESAVIKSKIKLIKERIDIIEKYGETK